MRDSSKGAVLLYTCGIMRKIVAIGGGQLKRTREAELGGGFYEDETIAIDLETIRLTGKKHPKILFIPTASGDSESYYEVVKEHFLSLGCSEVNVLYMSDQNMLKRAEDSIMSHDAIYVGGGNTLRMMTLWRKHGIEKMLQRAMKSGVVLSGLSAGAVCWFSYGNSDSRKFTSGSDKLIKVTGTGFIDALCCPHYDAEPHRQLDLKRMMQKTPNKVAIAIDNGAALVVDGDTYHIATSLPGAKVRKVFWSRGEYHIIVLKDSLLSGTLRNLITI